MRLRGPDLLLGNALFRHKYTDDIFHNEVECYPYEVDDIKRNHIIFGKRSSVLHCNRKESIINNETRVCNLLTDEEHITLAHCYNKAKENKGFVY